MRPRLLTTTTRPRRWLGGVVAASAALAGVAAVPQSAHSEVSEACPQPYPVADLVKGAAVTGLTVTQGETPEEFDGSVIGVLEDGIAPGIPMVLVDVESPAVDKAGIWSGMSGSPVYAADGKLIGAVAYSLGMGTSSVAGVTPAAEMYKLLTSSSAARVAPSPTARLSGSLQRTVAQTTGATGTTMKRLRVPVSMSGLGAARVQQLAPALNSQGVRLADTAAGAPSQTAYAITPGGNLAASMSYGTVTTAGVGTATAICGGEIIGFGHPMNFTGSSTMSLHGASATHIQDDLVSSSKIANIGAPTGKIDRDRLAGIRGREGALPTAYPLTAKATSEDGSFDALTKVTVNSLVPELAFATTITAQDRAIDRIGPGQAVTSWTVKGTRKDGSPFSYTRSNRYADSSDISAATAVGLAEELMAVQDNPGEVVKITSVDSTSSLEESYETYAISKVQYLKGKTWASFSSSRSTSLKQGSTLKLKITLTSRQAADKVVTTSVVVPKSTAGRSGRLTVVGGGNGFYSSEEFFDDEEFFFDEEEPAPSPSTFPALLKELKSAPANDEVVATLKFSATSTAGKPVTGKADADRVVSGAKGYLVRGTR